MAWLQEMSSYLKSQAHNQLVISASEGFFDEGSAWRALPSDPAARPALPCLAWLPAVRMPGKVSQPQCMPPVFAGWFSRVRQPTGHACLSWLLTSVDQTSTGRLTGPNVSNNPGAGAACEGEDFNRVNSLGAIDLATAHVYWRWACCEGHKLGVCCDSCSKASRYMQASHINRTHAHSMLN